MCGALGTALLSRCKSGVGAHMVRMSKACRFHRGDVASIESLWQDTPHLVCRAARSSVGLEEWRFKTGLMNGPG